jgi:hypothetical protein
MEIFVFGLGGGKFADNSGDKEKPMNDRQHARQLEKNNFVPL